MTAKKTISSILFGVVVLGLLGASITTGLTDSPYSDEMDISGQITTAIYDDSGKLVRQYTIPNLITNAGLDHIKYVIASGAAAGESKYISLGNGTSPVVGSTTLNSEWVTCGLSRATGTYYSNGVGNWTIAASWTSTCDAAQVNTTGMFNDTTAGMMFAGDTYSSTDTLNTNYVLQQNWTIWVV